MAKFKGIELTTYVDPFPGKKNTDQVQLECGNCTNGVYTGPSHISWARGNRSTTWCFQCNGTAVITRGAQSQRKAAMQRAWWAEYGQAEREAQIVESNLRVAAAEIAAAWDDANAEAARRASMVQGFLAPIGDKVTGLQGTVEVAKYMPSQRYGWSASMFIVVKLDNGQVVKMSGSGETLFQVERGDKVQIAGTVKNHADYKGQDQTILTRVKLTATQEVNA